MEGNVTYYGQPAGLSGATFGISYGSNIDVLSWTPRCGALEYRSATWPSSGSGNIITWDRLANCENTPASGDQNNGVTTYLGAFHVISHSAEVMAVTPNNTLPVPAFQVVDCQSAITELTYPQQAGKVAFGSVGGGYDPCKGPFLPLSAFQTLAGAELASLIVKFTDIDVDQARNMPHLLFLAPGAVEDQSSLLLYHRIEFDYSPESLLPGDAAHPKAVITTSEAQQIIQAISNLPAVADGGVDTDGTISLGLFTSGQSSVKAFESILNNTNARDAISAIRNVLTTPAAINKLDGMTCRLGLFAAAAPAEVTSNVSVILGGFRFDHSGKFFVSNVQVRNTSANTYSPPISLMLNEADDALVLNPTGVACRLLGPSYFDLPVGASFTPNEVVNIRVEIEDINAPKFHLTPKVYAGPGLR